MNTPFDEPDPSPDDLVCVACDTFASVDDLGLCPTCAVKLDRDMIRQRAWEYSISAFRLPKNKREALRKAVLTEFGKSLELVSPEKNGAPGTVD